MLLSRRLTSSGIRGKVFVLKAYERGVSRVARGVTLSVERHLEQTPCYHNVKASSLVDESTLRNVYEHDVLLIRVRTTSAAHHLSSSLSLSKTNERFAKAFGDKPVKVRLKSGSGSEKGFDELAEKLVYFIPCSSEFSSLLPKLVFILVVPIISVLSDTSRA